MPPTLVRRGGSATDVKPKNPEFGLLSASFPSEMGHKPRAGVGGCLTWSACGIAGTGHVGLTKLSALRDEPGGSLATARAQKRNRN